MKSESATDSLTKRIEARARRNRYRPGPGEPFQGSPADAFFTTPSWEIQFGAMLVWIISSIIIALNTLINELWRMLWRRPRFETADAIAERAWPIELKLIWALTLTALAAWISALMGMWGS